MKTWLIFLILSGCASSVTYVKPAAVAMGEHITFLGIDFSKAEFADPYLQPANLVGDKIPAWNNKVGAKILRTFDQLPAQLDLTTTTAHNVTTPPTALASTTSVPAAAIALDTVRGELASYVDANAPGKAAVMLVEQVSKERGVWAHMVLFVRATGEPVAIAREGRLGDGYGVFHFYFTALEGAGASMAKQLQRAVTKN